MITSKLTEVMKEEEFNALPKHERKRIEAERKAIEDAA
jgi:hypothetical protein